LHSHVIDFQCERWLTADGKVITAPLPEGFDGHFGPQLRRFVLAQYHQGQTTVPRLLALLRGFGIDISKRELVRLLTTGHDSFHEEAREVLRAGLASAAWITVDDTSARHKANNGFCTQIGNAHFTAFATTTSKSRLNFLSLLRAGHGDYVVNDAALAYMRERALAAHVISRLTEHPDRYFADQAAWAAHLEKLGIAALKVNPDPTLIATEGALWGSVKAHGFLREGVIVSDDAGRFKVGQHGLCWVHAERLVHKLDTFTDQNRAAQSTMRAAIWQLYSDLKAYRCAPTAQRKADLEAEFDRVFTGKTGFITLDRLLARLHANKAELLKVLDRPEIPLHTNGSENDIRCHVTRRKVSGGTRSDLGRDARDTFLGLAKTCTKLGISFWNYLGARLSLPGAPVGLGIHRHGVSGDGGEVAEERAEAVDRQAVIGALCDCLAVCGGGAACLGDDGGAGGLGGGLVVIVEQDGREHLAHVPLDIVGEHAQKHVGAHAIGTAMMNGPDLDIDGLEASKGALDVGELFIGFDG